jgi:hypothetical protein
VIGKKKAGTVELLKELQYKSPFYVTEGQLKMLLFWVGHRIDSGGSRQL